MAARVRNSSSTSLAAYISHPFHHPPRATHPVARTASRAACAFLLQVYNPLLLFGPLIPTPLPRIPTLVSTLPTPRRQFRLPRTPASPRYFPPFSPAKLSKRAEKTYLSCFFASISDLYEHLLKRLQRFCRMRVGGFEDRSEPASPTTSTAGSGARVMADQGPSFDMVVIGCGGGPFETNLSA